mmetsp:Transcript_22607/g.46356  ORF Transcript_22607/g.46356 Transcript_22607/m.46356 type:complete len:216 (-) Transcript_22607:66-713(-)
MRFACGGAKAGWNTATRAAGIVDAATSGFIEHLASVAVRGDVPTELLIELRGEREHTGHEIHVFHLPAVQRLVEASCTIEHTPHAQHATHIPAVDGLVEATGVDKHLCRSDHIGRVPTGYVIVEGFSARDVVIMCSAIFTELANIFVGAEQIAHIYHFRGVPACDVTVDGGSACRVLAPFFDSIMDIGICDGSQPQAGTASECAEGKSDNSEEHC